MKLTLAKVQKLSMSQQMKLSASLLALSQQELMEAIEKELLENPLLEIKEKESLDLENKGSLHSYNFLEPVLDNSQNEKQKNFSLEEFATQPEDLKSLLLKQKEQSFYPAVVKEDIELIISYLDEQGYLRFELDDLAVKNKISSERLLRALFALQSFEPYGVGARSLEECLLIQIRQKKIKNQKLKKLVIGYLECIKNKRFSYIAKELNISMKEVKNLCHFLEDLNPNPAVNFSSQPTVFLQPDIFIYKSNGDYHIEFNRNTLPQLSFSKEYLNQIKKSRKLSLNEKKYLKQKQISAKFFIYSLSQRQILIKKIALFIVRHQIDFFEKGPLFLKTLKMTDLAESLGVHVSTVSRVASKKVAYTPHGLFPLRSFFLKGAGWGLDSKVPVEQIKDSIKKWVAEETDLLSDEDLRKRIKESFNLSLSRRRIAQYRESLNIPTPRIRKKLADSWA